MSHGKPHFGGALLPRIGAAMLLASPSIAYADFTVNYDPVNAKISIVDNATGATVITPDQAVQHITFTRNQGNGDTTLEPSISWTPHGSASHADGLDLTFTFDNSAGDAPAHAGPVYVPGIVFGLPSDQLGRVRTRDFLNACKAIDLTTTPPDTGWNTLQEPRYPQELFSPLAYLHAGSYAVGISVLYPIVDPACGSQASCASEYRHSVGLGIHLPNPQGGRCAWELQIPFATRDLGGSSTSTEGFVPCDQVRQYTVCVRVMGESPLVVPADPSDPLPENLPAAALATQNWMTLFTPYRDYFQQRYGGVQYTPDPRPVHGCTTTSMTLVSPSNPYGFVELPGGGGRPYPDGWSGWHSELQYFRLRGWHRYMIWTPSGLFPGTPTDYNFPFQFTSQWSEQVVPGGEPSVLHDITDGQGSQLGLWWGNSASLMTVWPPTPTQPPVLLDPTNPQHVAFARAEMNGAVTTANAVIVGLDTFPSLPAWVGYHWLRQLQEWYPQVRFIQESRPCDVMSTLSPGFVTATWPNSGAYNRVTAANYMSELLLPGHELWAQIDVQGLTDELGHQPSIDDFLGKAHQIANLGYVPVIFDDISITADDISAQVPVGVIPCGMLVPRIVQQPPATVRVTSGEATSIAALSSNPPTDQLQWMCAHADGTWADLADQPGHIAGTRTATLSLIQLRQSDAGQYRLRVQPLGACVNTLSNLATLTVCASRDFNHDGDVATDADIEAFLACIAGSCCPTCDSADIDGDGDTATDADIEAFFRLLAGEPC